MGEEGIDVQIMKALKATASVAMMYLWQRPCAWIKTQRVKKPNKVRRIK